MTDRTPSPSQDNRGTARLINSSASKEVEEVVAALLEDRPVIELRKTCADLLTRLSAERDELMDINAANYTKAREAEAERDALKADMVAAVSLFEDPHTLREAAAISVGGARVRLHDEANEIERLTSKYAELHATLSGERT